MKYTMIFYNVVNDMDYNRDAVNDYCNADSTGIINAISHLPYNQYRLFEWESDNGIDDDFFTLNGLDDDVKRFRDIKEELSNNIDRFCTLLGKTRSACMAFLRRWWAVPIDMSINECCKSIQVTTLTNIANDILGNVKQVGNILYEDFELDPECGHKEQIDDIWEDYIEVLKECGVRLYCETIDNAFRVSIPIALNLESKLKPI